MGQDGENKTDELLAQEKIERFRVKLTEDATYVATNSEQVQAATEALIYAERLRACALAVLEHEVKECWEMERPDDVCNVILAATMERARLSFKASELFMSTFSAVVPFVDALVRISEQPKTENA